MLQEIRTNLFNATKPWDGLVVPFQTEVWYKEPDSLRSLPVNLQNELSEAYIDIGLANDIYWLLSKLQCGENREYEMWPYAYTYKILLQCLAIYSF